MCGHSSCGAVKSALAGGEGLPTNLSKAIKPVLRSIEGEDATLSAEEAELMHIRRMTEIVKENETVKKAGTLVVPAYYNIETRAVIWLDEN